MNTAVSQASKLGYSSLIKPKEIKCLFFNSKGHKDNKKFHPVDTSVPKVISVSPTEMSELTSVKAEIKIPNNEYESDSVYGNLKKIGDQLYSTQNATNIWCDTPLESINELKPDPAGKVGEELMKAICLVCGIRNESTGDKNSKDGTYDQKVGDTLKKVEIKTARLGGGRYQHETLKKEGCDYFTFFDINPDGGCITILPRFDLTNKHPITGTTPSLRKGTSDVFKWDFSENHLAKFVAAGVAIRFDKNTPMSHIGDFIKLKII
jgi:hypothetical protein